MERGRALRERSRGDGRPSTMTRRHGSPLPTTDEVGTPYCVTVDVKTVGDSEKSEAGDGRVTIRERDGMEQIRVPIEALDGVFARLLDEGAGWADVARDFPRAGE